MWPDWSFVISNVKHSQRNHLCILHEKALLQIHILSCNVIPFLWFRVLTKAITIRVTYYIGEWLCHKCLIETSPTLHARTFETIYWGWWSSQFPPAEKERWELDGKHRQVRPRFWTPGQKFHQLLPPSNMQTQVFRQDLKPKPGSSNVAHPPIPSLGLAPRWRTIVIQLHVRWHLTIYNVNSFKIFLILYFIIEFFANYNRRSWSFMHSWKLGPVPAFMYHRQACD